MGQKSKDEIEMRKLLMLGLILMVLSPLFLTPRMARADVLDGGIVSDETTAKKDKGPRKPAPKPGPRDGDGDGDG